MPPDPAPREHRTVTRAASAGLAGLEWDLARIGAPSAWAQGADGHGVRILVLDTGLDRTQAMGDLAGRILPSMAVNPLHGRVGAPCAAGHGPDQGCTRPVLLFDPSPYVDMSGHGSFVVSEIVADGHNPYGYWGVAPAARVAMARVSVDSSFDSRDVASALRWGVAHRFPIITMSLEETISIDPILEPALKEALAAGILVVAATGNEGSPGDGLPAAEPGVIAVGASDQWNGIAAYSNGGASIAAPGDWVVGLAPKHPTAINCGGLCQWEGTSMAAPLVAGALADLLSWGLSPPEARAALLAGATRVPGGDPTYFGAGVLNILGAMHWASACRLGGPGH